MIIEIDRDHLLKTVIIAESAVPSKPVNPILANCCFHVYKDFINIVATDNEIAVKTKVDAISDNEISFTCDGKRLSQILKEFPKGSILIKVSDSFTIEINSKSDKIKGSYKLIGTSAEDYPDINSVETEKSIDIDQVVFKDMIKKVVYAASNDSIKPVFNGIFFNTEGSNLIAVSSDSRRLSISRKAIDADLDMGEGIIVPLKTIHEISKLLNVGLCSFSFNENQCFFKIDNTEIISRLIEGNFPNYKQVIPKDYKSECVIDNQTFVESVRRAMIFTREPTFKIICSFSKDQLHIEAKTPDLGEAEESIDIEMDKDESVTLGINAQYIMDAVKEIESLELKVCLTGEMSPVTFLSESDDSYQAIVMPIQIKSNS